MTLDTKVNFIKNSIIESYIAVMGEEKWDSLSGDEQHEVIMTICKDLLKSYEH